MDSSPHPNDNQQSDVNFSAAAYLLVSSVFAMSMTNKSGLNRPSSNLVAVLLSCDHLTGACFLDGRPRSCLLEPAPPAGSPSQWPSSAQQTADRGVPCRCLLSLLGIYVR